MGANTNVKQIEASKSMGIEAIQIIYNRLDDKPEGTAFPICRKQNLGVLARVPLASGTLSGKYQPGHSFDKDEVRGRWGADRQEQTLKDAQRIKTEEYEKQVDPARFSMAEWALAWVLQNDVVSCVIPGCKSVAQVESNAKAADIDTMVKADHPQATR